MHSDWQKRTACCVSHIKQRNASLTTLVCSFYNKSTDIPLLLLSIYPGPPVILEVFGGVLQSGWPDILTIASADQVDQQAVEEVGHIVLLLPSSALAKAFDEQNCLQHPQVRFGREPSICEDLRSQNIMDAHLVYVSSCQ
jgi:hypothetical protein